MSDFLDLLSTGRTVRVAYDPSCTVRRPGPDHTSCARTLTARSACEEARDDLLCLVAFACQAADVGDPGPSEVAARRAVDEFGTIDILVNNVGGRRIDVPTEALATADWQRIIDLNLTGAFIWTKVVGGAMLPRGWGRVLNVA